MVHTRPLLSVAVSGDRYSVRYSVPGSWLGLSLDANYRRVWRPGDFGS